MSCNNDRTDRHEMTDNDERAYKTDRVDKTFPLKLY